MVEDRDGVPFIPPQTVAPTPGPKLPPSAYSRKHRRLTFKVVGGEQDSMYKLLISMKKQSGLSVRALAERMGISRNSLNQYFWQRRGEGGSSRLSWFLRYAAACGYTVWLVSPSLKEQVELKARHSYPPGNPNWRKKDVETVE